ncbi:hydroxyacid dehydrogenase [Polynucleobacter aenigmaticus]|uniref:Hydroxyacid dehydrogenase n=1 Tax=Polynucleobacter aenigmaticus TaxID=1743164 RepID=A0A254Q744_9BURK|nr:NAD(P)-dependent oxidoreductase [Polynucleobacter aenigmaticus]OWS71332.1 hydroxyacid dehydrogenase [Polynucleobacter aenigmaticus]
MNKRFKVLLTNPIYPEFHQMLSEDCDVIVAPDTKPETLKGLISDCDGLIVRCQLPQDIFDGAHQLKAVVRHGVGLDFIPVDVATQKGIPIANLPGSNTNAVVEYCLAAIFHFRRRLGLIDSELRARGWAKARPLADPSSEIATTTLGIIGFGSIGSKLANAATGLQMQTIALTRRPETLPSGVRSATKTELFSQSDVIVVCCPLNEETRGLVDQASVSMMKPNAILINIARGPVVDTQAIIGALNAGKIAGAAMDVHDQQPLSGEEAVFDCPNLLLTPHIASITASSMRGMSKGSVQTILAILKGNRTDNVVNPEVFV